MNFICCFIFNVIAPQIIILITLKEFSKMKNLEFKKPANINHHNLDFFFKKKQFDTLYYGAQGKTVQILQKKLNSFGFSLAVDGMFGSKTYQAVRMFQTIYAPPVDGIVGPITWKSLNTSSEKNEDKDTDEVFLKDFHQIGQQIIEATNDLEQNDFAAYTMFGKLLQQTGAKFLNASSIQEVSKSNFVPVHANGTQNSLSKDILKLQLDIMLKTIALAVDFVGLGTVNTNEMVLFKKAFVLNSIISHVQTKGLSPLPKKDIALFLKRVHLMRDFYNSFLKNKGFTSTPEIKKQNQIPGLHVSERQALIGIALSDVGKVRAKENPRYGGKHLKLIYDIAYNGKHPFKEHHFKNFSRTKQCAHGDTLCVKTNKKKHSKQLEKRDIIGSWCGIGALYWLKVAGQTDLVWKNGVSGLANKLKHRSFTEIPKVGDVVIDSKRDHHGIITWIDPNAKVPKNKTEWSNISIKTVESNVENGKIVHAPSGHGKLGHFDRGAFNSFKRK